ASDCEIWVVMSSPQASVDVEPPPGRGAGPSSGPGSRGCCACRMVPLVAPEQSRDVRLGMLYTLHSPERWILGSMISGPRVSHDPGRPAIDELDARLIELLTAEPKIGVLETSRRLGVARG